MLPPLRVDPLKIGQVLQNLVINAVQTMSNGGKLRIAAHRQILNKNLLSDVEDLNLDLTPYVEISLADTGAGVSAENMKKLFQPLFTTKTKGIGLGLVVCRNLKEAAGSRWRGGRRSGYCCRRKGAMDESPAGLARSEQGGDP